MAYKENEGGINKVVQLNNITHEPKICGCGKTKDVNGYCDGSHQHTTKKNT